MNQRDGPRHIVLVGLPGVGKSAVGMQVARLVGRPFLDSDTALGMTAMHRVERDETHDAAERSWFEHVASSRHGAVITMPSAVLTTGFDQDVSGALWIVWLDASPDTVAEHLRSDRSAGASSPPEHDSDDSQLLRERRLAMAQRWCDLHVVTGELGVVEAARLVADHWRSRSRERDAETVMNSRSQTALARSVGPDSPGT